MRSVSVSRSRNKSIDKNNRSYLPRISVNESRNADDSSILFENPFYMPADEELLNHKEKEKENRVSIRRNERKLKVWEKGPDPSMRHKLRKFLSNSFAEEEVNEHEDIERQNIIEAAKTAIKNRLRNKEPLKEFLSKKKEMFLFQLNINEKKEQIKEFEELAHLQDVSLQQSMQMLEKDASTFHKYVDESKASAAVAVRKAEDEAKESQKHNTAINKLGEALSNSISKNARKIEILERLYAFKVFIDKLTPEEFFKNAIDERPRSSGDFRARKYEDSEKVNFNWERYQIFISPQLKEFLSKDNGQNYLYFQKQEQMQLIFETLEEKNLFIMKHIQELEQNIEALKHNFNHKRVKLTEHQQQLQKNKKDMERTLHNKHREIEQIQSIENAVNHDTIYDRLEKALKTIYNNKRVLGEVKNEHEKDGFEMLKEIERKLDCQTKELDNYKPEKVLGYIKAFRTKRREEATLLKKQREDEEKKMKALNNLKRLTTQKRVGRPIMTRSHLKKEEKKEEVKDVIDPEEVERQLYFTKRFY